VADRVRRSVRRPADRPSPEFDALDRLRRAYLATAKANAWANVIRNVWAHGIIFGGHFPDQTYVFTEEEVRDEQPGGRYVRQLIGAANIEGGPFFHVMSGNLGYQVEHHLYPDMPSSRYGEIAPRVRKICKRYGLPYNTGRSRGNGGPCTARSRAWRSPAASRGRSQARGTARRSSPRASASWL
jgi:linoleoyl-CoA desaturase